MIFSTKMETNTKEVNNHMRHLMATLDRLISLLFSDAEMEIIRNAKSDPLPFINSRHAWIKTSDLAVENVTTEKMALIHLLWLQRLGRVIIEDVDPFSGAVLVHLDFNAVANAHNKYGNSYQA